MTEHTVPKAHYNQIRLVCHHPISSIIFCLAFNLCLISSAVSIISLTLSPRKQSYDFLVTLILPNPLKVRFRPQFQSPPHIQYTKVFIFPRFVGFYIQTFALALQIPLVTSLFLFPSHI